MWRDTSWVDTSDPKRIADPVQAYDDVRESHQWASRELAAAVDPIRVFNLTTERKRLADIAWQLKRRIG